MWKTVQVQALLEEHAHNGDHGQTTIGKLWRKFALLDNWILRRDELPSEVTNSPWSSRRLALRHFAEGHPGQNLTPSSDWDLRDSCQAVWNVCKLQAGGRGKVAREFSSNLWSHISHGGKHCNATMLDFSLTSALVSINIAVSCKSNWIPKSKRRLCAHLILKCSQRRSSVVGPVTPCTSGQAILRLRKSFKIQDPNHLHDIKHRKHRKHECQMMLSHHCPWPSSQWWQKYTKVY